MFNTLQIPSSQEHKTCVYLSRVEASELKQNFYDTPHLLIGLLRGGDEKAARLLQNHGVTLVTIREMTSKTTRPCENPVRSLQITRSPTAQRVFEEAAKKASSRGDETLEPLHLLWGILFTTTCQANVMLEDLGVNTLTLREEVEQALQHGVVELKGPYWKIKEALGDTTMSDPMAIKLALTNIRAAQQITL